MNWQEICIAQVLKSTCLLFCLGENHNLLFVIGLNKVFDLIKFAVKTLRNDRHASQLIGQLILIIAN